MNHWGHFESPSYPRQMEGNPIYGKDANLARKYLTIL